MTTEVTDHRAGYQREEDAVISRTCQCGAPIVRAGVELVHVGICPIKD